ncbi:hypothetical protein EV127DRAFT_428959 [Xylaria flabelliformis]|nr:hypothetical protein EV127DRAFT_428959 [Xylaria flabelliformis]
MFICRACLRKASNNVSRHSLYRNLKTGRYSLPSPSSRTYAAAATHAPSPDTTNAVIAPELITSSEFRDSKAPALGRSADWAARKELEYLSDPLHIANRVKTALDKDNFELAALITRKASKNNSVTVSWNHLIDYELQRGRLHAAIKLYNEMKKRAQQPNAQTFTIIFRGCAKSEHPKLALGEAYKLYQNMLSVGRIKPNVIHLNAVLKVCAKVGDLDSMFSILRSSDDPLRSPNNLTYTTIFNAMRMRVDKAPAGGDAGGRLGEEEIRKETESTIKRAKTIWEEVNSRWRTGSLIIDEELVCAMGRILLMGGYRDVDAVESLVEQTMMISRAENKGLSGREGTKSSTPAGPRSVFKAPGTPDITYASPGNNSLSLILEALEKTRRTTKAIKYWNVFTMYYHVVPDAENWTRALRVFYVGKNSGRAATTLQRMPGSMITAKHVRVAMGACLRDNLNKSAFDNATTILKIMGENPSIADVPTLRLYLQVAHASKRSFDDEAKNDYTGAMKAWAQNLAAALDHLFVPYQVVAKKCGIDPPNTNHHKALDQTQNSKAEVIALARKISAAYDILTNEHAASLTAAQIAQTKSRNAGLHKVITNYFERDNPRLSEQAEEWEDADDNVVEQREVVNQLKPLSTGARRLARREPRKEVKGSKFKQLNVGKNYQSRQWRDVDGEDFERKFANRAL